MKRRLVFLICLAMMLSPAGAVADLGAEAGGQVVRLSPSAFPELPPGVSQYLLQQGYTVPQSDGEPTPHNVVRGSFRRQGQTDWAVLASRDGVSEVLVFWAGSPEGVARLAERRDSDYLQSMGRGRLGYSRRLKVVGKQYILDHHREYGGPEPPAIEHDAIQDVFVEKASAIYYHDGRRWHCLQGAD